MLTREMCKGINNKMRGTGKRLDEVNKMYNTLTNSANSFLGLGATARVDEVPEVVAPKVEYRVVETIVEEPVVSNVNESEFVIPYFNTPFYAECKVIAEATNRHIDDVAWEQVARQLGVTIERAIFLVSNGLVQLRF